MLIETCLGHHTHSLQLRFELKPAVNSTSVTALTIERKDSLLLNIGLLDEILTKLKKLYLHRVSYQLTSFLYLDDGVIGSYIVQDRQIVRFVLDVLDHILGHLISVDNLSVELGVVGRHHAIEVHIILGEGTCLIKAAELDGSSRDNFALVDTEDLLLLQSLHSVDYSERHTHGKSRRHCN